MHSPHDNLPSLEGDVFLVTFQRAEDDSSSTFSTIQPNEREARSRLEWLAREEWDTTVEVEEVERFEGERHEQLTKLLNFYEESEDELNTPDTIKAEFAKTLLMVPAKIRRQMIQNLPEMLREEIADEIREINNPKKS